MAPTAVSRVFSILILACTRGQHAGAAKPSIGFRTVSPVSGPCYMCAGASRLGHSNPAFTLRTYAHVSPTEDGHLATRIQEILTQRDEMGVNSICTIPGS
jgi:hypothetical protein